MIGEVCQVCEAVPGRAAHLPTDPGTDGHTRCAVRPSLKAAHLETARLALSGRFTGRAFSLRGVRTLAAHLDSAGARRRNR